MKFLKLVLIILALSSSSAFAWTAETFTKPTNAELRKTLSEIQFSVTQKDHTERPFNNEFWNNKVEGIYVDVVSGEPLFSSLDKYDSGTGWPSFTRPLIKENIVEKSDRGIFGNRTEIRSKHADSHLGHVFNDGPIPTGLRYCMNSASLRFIPKAKLRESGYSELEGLFIQADTKSRTETATFAAGCFWGTEDFFAKIPGVISTQVGYVGGKTDNPHYSEMHDGHTGHAESVEIIFDPSKISFEKLMDSFYKMHDPTTLNRQGNDVGTQYRSAIFYQDEQQKAAAMRFKQKVEKSGAWHKPITTEISPAGKFWRAEEEHQHYLAKHPGGYDNHFLRKISF